MKELYINYAPFNGTEKEFLEIEEFEKKFWKTNGKLHREDGPAVIYSNGVEYWFQNGKCHRENGPARVWPDGGKHWYQDGRDLTWINDWLPLSYWICGDES